MMPVNARKSRNQIIFLGIIIIVFLAVKLFKKHDGGISSKTQDVIALDEHLIYTHHAKCRMNCRHITEENIREVIREGHINPNKSNDRPGDCPTYAIEDRLGDGTELRIVFAKCATETKVVTCIDRSHDFHCECE